MGKQILLTGGAGFIGSHTYLALLKAGYDVTILDNFENSHRDVPERLAQISKRPTPVIDCDIRSQADVMKAFTDQNFDAVVHFAARKSVPEGEADPVGYYQSNCAGFLNVISAMRAHHVGKIVFSSSAAIYGFPKVVPTPEHTHPAPESVYARTKVLGETILNDLALAHPEMTVGILRYFNPVGAHSSGLIGENPSQPPTNLVPLIARVAGGEMPALKVFGGDYMTPDGTCIRDYIHVEDLARGHVLSLHALFRGDQGHCVNLGTGVGYSVLDVINAYEKASDHPIPHEITDRRPGDPEISCAEVSKAKELLGFEAQFSLLDMCTSNWKYYMNQRTSR